VGDRVGIKEFVLFRISKHTMSKWTALTGTFFWVITTAVSLPRTEIAVCPEPDIALKAYSMHPNDGDVRKTA
jgi:hypothetical protein